MDKQKNLKISIFDKSYFINTDEIEEEIFSAASLVDSMLREQNSKTSVKDKSKLLVIVALQLANDLGKALNRVSIFENKINLLSKLIKEKTDLE